MTINEKRGSSNTPALRTDKTPSIDRAPLRILIDWLGFTYKPDTVSVHKVLTFFEKYLKIDRSYWKSGRKNYEGYAHSVVYENINIYYGGSENQGIHVDITGQGCRFLDVQYRKLRVQNQKLRVHDEYCLTSWHDLFDYLHSDDDFKFTRLDIACDDFHGYLNVPHMFEKCLKGEITMKFRSWSPAGKFDSNGSTNGLTLYFGSENSRLQGTVYEKNKQLNLDYHWTRFELRFGQQRASEVVSQILHCDHDIGIIFAGILSNYLTFRVPNENDSNKRRWNIAPFWTNFIGGIPKLQIASALPDRSIVRSSKWLKTQVARSLARCALAYKDLNDNWFQELLKEGLFKLDQEDFEMIKEYRDMFNNDMKYLQEDIIFTEKKD